MILAGLDIGTSTLCGLLLEAPSGRILAVETEHNAFILPGAQADEMTQDPEAILGAVERLLGRLTGGRAEVAGLGVTGQALHPFQFPGGGRDPAARFRMGRPISQDLVFCQGHRLVYCLQLSGH